MRISAYVEATIDFIFSIALVGSLMLLVGVVVNQVASQ